MELLYLWLENNNGIINKQGFNFSGKYLFSYSEGILKGEIRPNRNPNHFFNTASKQNFKINNITAIVGENGSGKTTLLQFIKEYLAYFDNAYADNEEYSPVFTKKFLLVIEEEGRVCFYNHGLEDVNVCGDIKIEIRDFDVVHRYEGEDDYPDNIRFIVPELKHTKIIYFSNVLDTNIKTAINNYDFDEIYLDISTNTLLFDEYDMYKGKSQINEFLRQIRFMFSPYADTLMSKKPDYLVVDTSWSSGFEISMKKMGFNYMDISTFCSEINLFFNEKSRWKELISEIVFASVLDYVNQYIEVNKNDKKSRKKKLELIIHDLKSIASNLIDCTAENLISNLNIKTIELFEKRKPDSLIGQERYKNRDVFREINESRISLIANLRQMMKFSNKQGHLKFEVPLFERQIIEEMLINCHSSCFEYIILTFSLNRLSSGEKAMLQTYARFYWLIDRYKNELSYRSFGFSDSGYHIDHFKLKKNLLILIDEGELFLHPNWQRAYLYNIINLFHELFKDFKEVRHIQIILSSNSPFVISDLPKENIILMENKDGACHVLDESAKFDTFGANIHMLLSNAFFMSNGVIGEFAKNKINEAIHLLRSDNCEENKDEIQYIINIIGEPVIRSKLQEMYDLRFRDQLQRVEEEILRLQQERERILNERITEND